MRSCCSLRLSELLISVAEIPRRWSASTWSFIKRDQGRDDDRCSLQQQSRQLITERFSAARWHYHQRIGTAGDGGDHFFLRVEKLSKAEVFFENVVRGHAGLPLCRRNVRAQGLAVIIQFTKRTDGGAS